MPTIYTNISNLPKRIENDFYPTPIELCRAALKIVPKDCPMNDILDPGAGDGVWGKALEEVYPRVGIRCLHGIEIREIEEEPLEYDVWSCEDFLEKEGFITSWFGYDLIMGNPPYKFGEEFLDKSFSLLRDDGYILFLLKLSFLESQSRYSKYYSQGLNPKEVYVSTRRVSFTGNKKSNADAYGIFLWQKDWKGETTLKWLDWNYDR